MIDDRATQQRPASEDALFDDKQILARTPNTVTDIRRLKTTDTTPGAADFPAKKLPALPPQGDRGFLTTSELQKTVLPLSRRSIFDYRRRGIIPSIQIGSKILYHKESVIAALLRRQNGGVVQ
jgi:hypothetical protein